MKKLLVTLMFIAVAVIFSGCVVSPNKVKAGNNASLKPAYVKEKVDPGIPLLNTDNIVIVDEMEIITSEGKPMTIWIARFKNLNSTKAYYDIKKGGWDLVIGENTLKAQSQAGLEEKFPKNSLVSIAFVVPASKANLK